MATLVKSDSDSSFKPDSNVDTDVDSDIDSDVEYIENHKNLFTSNKKRRQLTDKETDQLLELQAFRCANRPNSDNVQTKDHKKYYCLLWKCNEGFFDESGFDKDHINEFSISKDNSLDNFQLLCVSCHRVKTKLFLKYKGKYTSPELFRGQRPMDVDNPSHSVSSKKKKILKSN